MRAFVEKPTISILGAGKVGATLARALSAAGYRVVVVYSRTRQSAEQLSTMVGARVGSTIVDVLAAELVLITVPDDAIASVADALATLAADQVRDKAFVHTSGAHDVACLAALAESGGIVGSLHPALPFADVEKALTALRGAGFALETDDPRLREWLFALVAAFGGQAFIVPSGEKARYHAALVMASNYTVTLYAIAEQLLTAMGADRATSAALLLPLMQATMENLREKGVPDALTGPLTRADIGTVAAHLGVLSSDNDLQTVYRLLARLSFSMLDARGVDTAKLRDLLQD